MDIVIPAGKTTSLQVDEKDYGRRHELSVSHVKDGGWTVKIKDSETATDCIARVTPGQTIGLIPGKPLFAESVKETKLTVNIPA